MSQTQLSLNNVQLDTEKLSVLPGIYIRDGTIDKVDLKLAVLGGVQIEGSGVRLTVSLTKKVLEDQDNEVFSSFLERTTADLAESIMISADTHRVDEDLAASLAASMNLQLHPPQPPGGLTSSFTSSTHSDDSSASGTTETGLGLGYGMGDFSGVVNRVADAAISQLSVALADIKITLLIDDVTLELSVSSVKLSTNDDGVRCVSISDVECILIQPPEQEEEDDELEFDQDITVSAPSMFKSTIQGPMESNMMRSMYHDADNGFDSSNLMQSMMFSREEANSIYMSAMAASELDHTPKAEPTKSRVFWSESLKLSFKGLKMAALVIEVGRVHLSIKHLPTILLPLLTFVKSHADPPIPKRSKSDHNKHPNTPSQEPEIDEDGFSLAKAVVQHVEINLTSALIPNGLYEDDSSIRLVLDKLEYLNNISKKSQTFEVSTISLEGRPGPIFVFQKNGISSKDLVCQISKEKTNAGVCKLMVPNPGKLKLAAADIFELQDIVKSYNPIFEIITSLQSTSPSPTSPDRLVILGQTSVFDLKLILGATILDATVFPISFDAQDTISCPQVTILLPQEGNAVSFKDLTLQYGSSITSKLNALSGKITCDVQYLKQLGEEFKHLQANWVSTTKHMRKPHPRPDTAQYKRAQHEIRSRPSYDGPILEINVKYLGLQVVCPGTLGKIDIDLGDLHTVLKRSGKSTVELSTIHVSRDMSDIDPTLGHLSIIHKVNDRKLVRYDCDTKVFMFANFLD